jgi:hypothetical protein
VTGDGVPQVCPGRCEGCTLRADSASPKFLARNYYYYCR